MHVVWCVCVCVWSYRLFASLDLTASWRGGLMQSNPTEELPFDRHKVVMDITFAAWYEVNIAFVEWLLCVTLWMLCFVFDMSERMSEDMSERMSKDMSERISEDMSERMSKDMSERMLQSVCEVESNRTYFRR